MFEEGCVARQLTLWLVNFWLGNLVSEHSLLENSMFERVRHGNSVDQGA